MLLLPHVDKVILSLGARWFGVVVALLMLKSLQITLESQLDYNWFSTSNCFKIFLCYVPSFWNILLWVWGQWVGSSTVSSLRHVLLSACHESFCGHSLLYGKDKSWCLSSQHLLTWWEGRSHVLLVSWPWGFFMVFLKMPPCSPCKAHLDVFRCPKPPRVMLTPRVSPLPEWSGHNTLAFSNKQQIWSGGCLDLVLKIYCKALPFDITSLTGSPQLEKHRR